MNKNEYPYNLIKDVFRRADNWERFEKNPPADWRATFEYFLNAITAVRRETLILYYKEHLTKHEIAKKRNVSDTCVAKTIEGGIWEIRRKADDLILPVDSILLTGLNAYKAARNAEEETKQKALNDHDINILTRMNCISDSQKKRIIGIDLDTIDGLPFRVLNALKNASLNTVVDVIAAWNDGSLKKVSRLGPSGYQEITNIITERYGISI